MNKLVMGESFTDESQAIGSEVKETVSEKETVKEKENSTESSTEEKPAESEESLSSETEEKGDTTGESKDIQEDKNKIDALEALRKEEESLNKDVSELDAEIERRKQSISEKRTERRERREIVKAVDQVVPEVDELKDIDKDTLDILERYTKAKGLFPQSKLIELEYGKEQKRSERIFFKAHPQYLPENDKDDALYNALKKELALYAPPKDSEMFTEIYERAHKAVRERFQNSFPKSTQSHLLTQRRVQLQSGATSSGSSSASNEAEGFSEKQIDIMRKSGYTDEDIKHLSQFKK